MTNKITFSVIILGVALLLSGCGQKIVEKTIETQTGGKVDINSNSGEMKVKSDEGDFSMSGTGTATLSPDFPRDVYMAPDAKIIFSMANGQDKSYSVAYNTETQTDDIYNKYKEDLIGKGWTVDTMTEVTIGEAKTVSYKKGSSRITVIVGPTQDEQNKGKTSVQVTGVDDKASEPSL